MRSIKMERRAATYRWRGFTDCLEVGLVDLLRLPGWPRRWLPLAVVRQMAQIVGPWLLAVLAERQQRERWPQRWRHSLSQRANCRRAAPGWAG